MIHTTREQRRELERVNARMPIVLQRQPRESWSTNFKPDGIAEVWRSRDFLVQIYEPVNGGERLSICRTTIDPATARWLEGIGWDDLQRLKSECGRGDCWAVEIFPADSALVNVANMRHLWVLAEAPPFAWKTGHPKYSINK